MPKPLAPPRKGLPVYNPGSGESQYSRGINREEGVAAARRYLGESGTRKPTLLQRKLKARKERKQNNLLKKRVKQRIRQSVEAEKQRRGRKIKRFKELNPEQQKFVMKRNLRSIVEIGKRKKVSTGPKPEGAGKATKVERALKGIRRSRARGLSNLVGKAGKVLGPAAVYFTIKDALEQKRIEDEQRRKFLYPET